MSLARLLSAGKSLVGGMDNTIRYRMGNPGMLPRFGSGRNPFLAGAKREGSMQLTQPPEPRVEPHKPVLSPSATTTRQQREGEGRADSAPVTPLVAAAQPTDKRKKKNISALNWSSTLLSIWQGWLESVKARLPPRSPKHARSDISQAAKSLVQPELSLDKVRVVRNDLSDTDLEVVPVTAPMALKIETVTKPGRGDARGAGEPRWTSGRPDEVQPSDPVVTQTAIGSAKWAGGKSATNKS